MVDKEKTLKEISAKLDKNNRLIMEVVLHEQEGNLSYFLQQNAKMALAKYAIEEELII